MTTSQTLVSLAQRAKIKNDATKSIDYYAIYDKYFEALRDRPIKFAEIGVSDGISLNIFSEYFKRGKILGIDLHQTSNFYRSNITYAVCDQTDEVGLHDIINRFAPDGLDVVVDDASHIGFNSLKTFEILFPRLKIGGLYVVEDWGTGYWDDWPDGGRYQRFDLRPFDGHPPRRIPSHDFGMVGFIKHLTDILAANSIRPTIKDEQTRLTPFEYLHLYHGVAVMKKLRELSW